MFAPVIPPHLERIVVIDNISELFLKGVAAGVDPKNPEKRFIIRVPSLSAVGNSSIEHNSISSSSNNSEDENSSSGIDDETIFEKIPTSSTETDYFLSTNIFEKNISEKLSSSVIIPNVEINDSDEDNESYINHDFLKNIMDKKINYKAADYVAAFSFFFGLSLFLVSSVCSVIFIYTGTNNLYKDSLLICSFGLLLLIGGIKYIPYVGRKGSV